MFIHVWNWTQNTRRTLPRLIFFSYPILNTIFRDTPQRILRRTKTFITICYLVHTFHIDEQIFVERLETDRRIDALNTGTVLWVAYNDEWAIKDARIKTIIRPNRHTLQCRPNIFFFMYKQNSITYPVRCLQTSFRLWFFFFTV